MTTTLKLAIALVALASNGCTVIGIAIGSGFDSSKRHVSRQEIEASRGEEVSWELAWNPALGPMERRARGELTAVEWPAAVPRSAAAPRSPHVPSAICLRRDPADNRPRDACARGFDAIYEPADNTGSWVGGAVGATLDVLVLITTAFPGPR